MNIEKSVTSFSVKDAEKILAEQKYLIKNMEWIAKKTSSNPQWLEYISACQIKSEIKETYQPHTHSYLDK